MEIRLLCLGVLSLGEASGYAIREALRTRLVDGGGASWGSLYPALAALAAAGHIAEAPAEGRGPAALERRVFRITEPGLEELRRGLAAARGREAARSEFLAAIQFAHLLERTDIERLVDERIVALRERAMVLRRQAGSPIGEGQRFALRYAQATTRAALEFLEREGRTLAAAIAFERRGRSAEESR